MFSSGRPVQKVRRRAAANPSNAGEEVARASDPRHAAEVPHVFPCATCPRRRILSVSKGYSVRIGSSRIDLPPKSIGRGERKHYSPDADECLVLLLRLCVGVRVLERREVDTRLGPYDVVVLRSVELDEAEAGLRPVNAVIALGVASDRVVVGVLQLRVGTVPSSKLALIGKGDEIGKPANLPWVFRFQGDALPGRGVEDALDAGRGRQPKSRRQRAVGHCRSLPVSDCSSWCPPIIFRRLGAPGRGRTKYAGRSPAN